MRIVIASGNAGKIREIRAALSEFGVEPIPQDELGIRPCPEDFPTFIENSLVKARHASGQSGLPALADDSGICVRALRGAPGVRSARFAGPDADDEANLALLLERMEGVEDRAAAYQASMVLVMSPYGPSPVIAEGYWKGSILRERRGDGGFGYDPVFLDEEAGKTGAEMSVEEKNRVSHRGEALRILVEKLRRRGIGAR